MEKTKLQELCHLRRWQLPEYSTTKEGPGHDLRFQATVTVNGLSFHSPAPARSSKEAQNEAAKLALHHLSATTAAPSSAPFLSPPPPSVASSPARSAKEAQNDAAKLSLDRLSATAAAAAAASSSSAPIRSLPTPPPQPVASSPARSAKEAQNEDAKLALNHLSATAAAASSAPVRSPPLPSFASSPALSAKEAHNEAAKLALDHLSVAAATSPFRFPQQPPFASSPDRSAKEAQNEATKLALDHLSATAAAASSAPVRSPPPPSFASSPALSAKEAHNEATKLALDHLSVAAATSPFRFPQQPPFDSSPARSAKEAQNEAAKLALDHLSAASPASSSAPIRSPPPPLASSSGSLGADTEMNSSQSVAGSLQVKQQKNISALGGLLQVKQQQNQNPPGNATSAGTRNDDNIRANQESSYKNLLQELAHKKGWQWPSYSTNTIGKAHVAAFVSTVEVEGESFTGQEARSKKQAEMNAAKVAYTSLTQRTLQMKVHETDQTLQGNASSGASKDDDRLKDMHHLYKNLLQTYAQKRNLLLPVYSWERVGPPHASRFKCNVTIDGQNYESQGLFTTLVEGEHAAAKVALTSLSPKGIEEEESAYKNLLQEMVQKNGCSLPVYNTSKSGQSHQPTFVSTVEVQGQVFTGLEARTKKQAELSAAKSAYNALKHRNPGQIPESFLSVSPHGTLQLTSSMSQSDLTAYLNQNFQPKMPMPDQQIEDRGAARSLATFKASSASGLSIPSHIDGLSSSPSPSEASANVAKRSSGENFVAANTHRHTKVLVHPREIKMTYPPGSTMVPMRDENWIAAKIVPQSNTSV